MLPALGGMQAGRKVQRRNDLWIYLEIKRPGQYPVFFMQIFHIFRRIIQGSELALINAASGPQSRKKFKSVFVNNIKGKSLYKK